MRKTLGQRIRELRERRDISLREFAKKMKITASHQSDIELGRRFPSDSLLERFSAELEEAVEEMRKYDNRVPVEQIRRIIQDQPAIGFALRTVMDKVADNAVSAQDLLDLTKRKPKRERK